MHVIGPYGDLIITVRKKHKLRTGRDHPTGQSTRREKERQIEKEMGRYHIRMDRVRVG